MSVLSPDLVRRIVERHHVVTAAELLGDGLSRRDLATWLATGVLTELTRDTFAVTDALRVEPFLTRAAGACIGRDRVCDALTSARCWELPGVFPVSRPTTTRRHSVHGAQVVDRPDGIVLLSPAATWFGLARHMRPQAYRAWSQSVLGHRIDVVDAHVVVRAAADPRSAPHRRAAAVLSRRRRWQRPSGGELERRVRASFRRRGVTCLDGSHTISLDDGFDVHPTVVDHDLRWGLEIDHVGWHGGRHSEEFRRWIDRRLERAGWTIVTVSDRRLERDFAATMREATACRVATTRAA